MHGIRGQEIQNSLPLMPERDVQFGKYGELISVYWNLQRRDGEDRVQIFTVKFFKPTDERALQADFRQEKVD